MATKIAITHEREEASWGLRLERTKRGISWKVLVREHTVLRRPGPLEICTFVKCCELYLDIPEILIWNVEFITLFCGDGKHSQTLADAPKVTNVFLGVFCHGWEKRSCFTFKLVLEQFIWLLVSVTSGKAAPGLKLLSLCIDLWMQCSAYGSRIMDWLEGQNETRVLLGRARQVRQSLDQDKASLARSSQNIWRPPAKIRDKAKDLALQ